MKVELIFLVFIEIFIIYVLYKQVSVKSCIVTELFILNHELIFYHLIFYLMKVVPRKLEMISK